MIDHDKKIIFVHLQRTGGSMLEKNLIGKDMWSVDSSRKHLLASQAKELYKEYWDDYFKFAIVRDPWARTVSMLKFPGQFGLTLNANKKIVGIENYLKKYRVPEQNVFIENDPRFSKIDQLFDASKHLPQQLYSNVLDEELDYIAKFETLKEDMEYISDKVKFNFELGRVKQGTISYTDYFDDLTKDIISDLYKKDIEKFGYHYGGSGLLTAY